MLNNFTFLAEFVNYSLEVNVYSIKSRNFATVLR